MAGHAGEAPKVDPALAEILETAAQQGAPRRGFTSRLGQIFRPNRTAGGRVAGQPASAAIPASMHIESAAEATPPVPFPVYADEPAADATESLARGPLVELREPVPAEKLSFMPWLSICRLEIVYQSGRRATATGFLTRSGLVATSAHVVLHPDPLYATAAEITVVPGYAQPPDSGMAQVSRTFFRNARWGQSNEAFLTTLDYAAIKLPDPFAVLARFGFLDWDIPADLDPRRDFMISGYPGELQGQWRHASKIVGEPGQWALRHSIMTTEGQSGSPMFVISPEKRISVVGIHSKASSLVPGANVARRVTNELIADFANWSAGLAGPMA